MAQAEWTGRQRRAVTERRGITLAEYLDALSDAPYEVIDGELVEMTPQKLTSSLTQMALYDSLHPFVAQHKLGRVFYETACALDVDDRTHWVEGSLVPDVSFISRERLLEKLEQFEADDIITVAPDLAVEVISSTDRFSKVLKKVAIYLQHGTQVVWVIDPQRRVAHVYAPDNPDGHMLGESESLSAESLFPGWSMAIRDLLDMEIA